jgi:hypothetical protein
MRLVVINSVGKNSARSRFLPKQVQSKWVASNLDVDSGPPRKSVSSIKGWSLSLLCWLGDLLLKIRDSLWVEGRISNGKSLSFVVVMERHDSLFKSGNSFAITSSTTV